MKILAKMTKGKQVTIPAKIRHQLDIDESTLLDVEFDKKRKIITIEPIQSRSLEELFKEWNKVKLKTKKSIKELEEEYERESMLDGF